MFREGPEPFDSQWAEVWSAASGGGSSFQASIAEQIAQYEDANQEYFKDGVRLLELSKNAYFLFKKQNPREKRRLLNFVCSNSTWKDRTLTATFRQPFDILAVTNTAWQRQKAAGATSSDLRPIWLPTLDTLRNFFLVPTTEMLRLLQQARDVAL